MNLNIEIEKRLLRLLGIEEKIKDSKKIKKYIEDERKGLMTIQLMLFKALKEEYPFDNISTSYEMFTQFNFYIKVTKK